MLIPISMRKGRTKAAGSPRSRKWDIGRQYLAAGLALAILGGQIALAAKTYPKPPQLLFGDLYAAVEDAQIFPDGKEFADAVPKESPTNILAAYRISHPETQAALRRFVLENFMLPQSAAEKSVPAGLPLAQHIDALWDVLTRQPASPPPYSSLLPLPYPYVVPGGRFREMYYWDSYFTMLGLVQSGRSDLVTDMVRDFAALIDRYGHIPNGNRTYYLSRSQPPFFFEMVALTDPHDPAAAFAKYLPELKREYTFWMAEQRVITLPGGARLNRYWDDSDLPRDESYRQDAILARSTYRPSAIVYRDVRAAAESGWDFSSRWFADGRTLATIDTTDIIPVDLNSLLFGLENAIRFGCERNGDAACAKAFANKAAARRTAIDRFLWNAQANAYFDYNWRLQASVKRLTAATLYPLFTNVAGKIEAQKVAQTARRLVKPGGLVTTLADTGQQWDAPNGWAPLQWIAVKGLRRYGASRLAHTIACRWIANVRAVYRRTGRLVEKYDVMTLDRPGGGGEYKLQDGFGWTNGVTLKLMALYPTDANYSSVSQCPKLSPVRVHETGSGVLRR